MAAPSVTAGLKWPPETLPTAAAPASSARPPARATARAFCWLTKVYSATPMIARTRKNVPKTSAPRRARRLGWTTATASVCAGRASST
ncbi:Uncharacterised protein [Mycobacteroides abscessus]|nr:Uncharacterised protein [Mycobacteroides abscessus]